MSVLKRHVILKEHPPQFESGSDHLGSLGPGTLHVADDCTMKSMCVLFPQGKKLPQVFLGVLNGQG